MVILRVEPRYHSNQVPIMDGFLRHGDTVHICVFYFGDTEKRDNAQIHVIEPSWITRLAKKLLERKGLDYAERTIQKIFIPKVSQLKRIIKAINPDIVIVREITLLSVISHICCSWVGIKTVLFTEAPLYSEPKPKMKKALKHLVMLFLPKFSYTPCLYYSYPKKGINFQTEKNRFFIPYIPRNCAKSISYPKGKETVQILDSGKFRYIKNHFILVDSAEILKNKGYSNFHIHIQGQCVNSEEIEYYNRLQGYINEKGLEDLITLEGTRPYDEMESLFLSHHVYVLPSIRDCANISIIDAMSYGLATISTDNNGTASYIKHNVTGSIFRTNDAEDLAEQIEKYLVNLELIKQHGSDAKEVVDSEYGFEEYYHHFTLMMKTVCGKEDEKTVLS